MDQNKLNSEIQTLSKIGDNKQKLDGYSKLVDNIFKVKKVALATSLADHILSDEVPIAFARQVLQLIAKRMEDLSNDEVLELGLHICEKISGRVVSFEEEDLVIRDQIAEVYNAKKDYTQAARTLAALHIESGNRTWTVKEKVAKYVQIAEYYLEDDDAVSAESWISKATMIVHEADDLELDLRARVCNARIYDSKRKFLHAAIAFYNLSQSGVHGVAESELLQLLNCAMTCAILGKAGPQRSRILATIYKDERSRGLANFEIVEKMFMDRILRKPEVEKFAEGLLPHQMARVNEDFTVLDKAMIEHNMIAISKIYNNITFEQLGSLLEITAQKAEEIIASMITEKRVKAVLDQLSGTVEFTNESEVLHTWDAQITSVCRQVDDLITVLGSRYPEIIDQMNQ